jgi:hypothetical protein
MQKNKSQKAWVFPANCLYIALTFAKRKKKRCAGLAQTTGLSGSVLEVLGIF